MSLSVDHTHADLPPSSMMTSLLGRDGHHERLCWHIMLGMIGIHVIAIVGGWYYFSFPALALALVLHVFTINVGIAMGFHRLFSHRSFRVPKPLEYCLAILGTLAFQDGIIQWVAHHRIHHADTDQSRDPHSRNQGFWWSHILWMWYRTNSPYFDYLVYRHYAADLDRDRFYRFLNDHWKLPTFILGCLLYAWAGMPGLIYGIFVRIVLGWHITFLVNSAAHTWGKQPFRSHDADHPLNNRASNLWWLNLIELGNGEAWHHNHHMFPKSAQVGLHWWQLDLTYGTVRLLESLGLATQVHRIPNAEILRKQYHEAKGGHPLNP